MQLTDDACNANSMGDAVCRLTRLIGDEDQAKDKVKRLRSIIGLINEDDLEAESEIFKAMSDPCRLMILKLLKDGELCACEIMVAINRPQSTTSHHLSILKDAGLIKERKNGRWSRYRLSEGAVVEVMNLISILRKK